MLILPPAEILKSVDSAERDARLLRAIAGIFGDARFNAYLVGVQAVRDLGLLRALSFLAPTIDRHHGALSRRTTAAVLRWLVGMLNRDIDGLRLERDSPGCFHIEDGNVVVGPFGLSR